MEGYKLTDERLFQKLFLFDYDRNLILHEHFVEFHKIMFTKVLAVSGINIVSYNDDAFVEASSRTFLDVGYFLKDADYIGNGKFLRESGIEYQTDVFEIMACMLINLVRQMPIRSVSLADDYRDDEISGLALNNPNEHAALSLYDQMTKLYCIKYRLTTPAIEYREKLNHIVFERVTYLMNGNSISLIKDMLRS